MTVTRLQLMSMPVRDQDRARDFYVDADVANLRVRGVAIEGGVVEQPWGRFVTFDDPDGNGLVLQETSPDA